MKLLKYTLAATMALLLPALASAQQKGLDERINEAFKPIGGAA
jgi:hypothetical protein